MSPRATWWAQSTPGVTYYRCTLPARFLPGQVLYLNRGEEMDAQEVDGKIVFPRQEGASIWAFTGNTLRALLMSEMQEQGIPVLQEFDDNYTIPPPLAEISSWATDRSHPLVKDFDAYNYQTATDVTKWVDGVIVSTPRLAEVYSEHNNNVHVCPNSVDPDDWEDDPPNQEDGTLRIGWAASDSHKYDAPLIRDALNWASTQKNVEIVVMGIKPWVSSFRFKYRHIPWTDSLEDYRKALRVFDVMLCPILQSEWSDCKSDVKAMEAAMAGACSVVSGVEPYRPWFDQPAYVAKHPWDFKKLLRHLVRNRDEVRETARLAREYVLAERTIQKNIHKWEDAISAPVSRRVLHRAISLSR